MDIRKLNYIPAGMTFAESVAMGFVEGASSVFKYGFNPLITSASDPETLWEFGGKYTYNMVDNILSISSSSDLDNQLMSVEGLDGAGNFVHQHVQLQGQTRVSLETPLWRVFRAENDADFPDTLQGTVYIYDTLTNTNGVPPDANVRAIVSAGVDKTLMSVFTVPLGKVGFYYNGALGISLSGNPSTSTEYAHFHLEARKYGKNFKVHKALDCSINGSSNFQGAREFPTIFTALTDIAMVVDEVSDDMGAWGTFEILLMNEELFTPEYLASIGQVFSKS